MSAGVRIGGSAAAVALLITLAGCTPTPAEQSDQGVPEVVWADGEPSGEFEQDAWVQAARSALTALAVAQNRNDFELPELVESTTYEVRSAAWRGARDRVEAGERTDVHPGPQPLEPQSVEVSADGRSASVQACVALDWSSPQGTPPESFDTAGAEYRLERTEDGRTVLDAIVGLPNLDCATADPAVGLFDPAPKKSSVTDVDQIVRPQTD
ncbi:hypothetical protein [Plantibacter cousiniae (nom. nud.)]|uniref:hypothetical protein n=1 Tax=Plantibacter cousiniae (nom. nud.) TaxID=199709 RepID=UPI001DFFBEA9|nr:hypothetical protein [Plantibacter cousiniae]CAH0213837.1 hypothetical protein SRABI02_02272 [Plantibacter cousiniae]